MKNDVYRNNRQLIGSTVQATYRESTNCLYRHNCFIEALPERFDLKELSRRVVREPAYDEEAERNKSVLERLDALDALSKCVFIMPSMMEFDQKFSSALRSGYCERNPILAEWAAQLRSAFPGLNNEGFEQIIRHTAAGFGVIGVSGVGKSLITECTLGAYPQVIIHKKYNGTVFMQKQLVWLKLDCPDDATLSGLCISFFDAVDRVIGTNYVAEYGIDKIRLPNIAAMVRGMCKVAASLGLGILVIDEIQRLTSRNGNDPKGLLKFFERLTNTLGVPVLLMGTPKAFNLFSSSLATARRIAGQGDLFISNLKYGEEWDWFVRKLWRYQYTQIPTPLSEGLSRALYDESQGIVDFAVKLYKLVQTHIISQGEGIITPKLISEAGDKYLNVAKPILTALRNNDLEKLKELDDVRIDYDKLDEYFRENARRITLLGSMKTLENQQKTTPATTGAMAESPVGHIASLLVKVGYSPNIAMESAIQALARFAKETDLKKASAEAFRIAACVENTEISAKHPPEKIQKQVQPPPPKIKTAMLNGDLRLIHEAATKAKRSVYDVLKEAGYIKSLTDFLEVAHV